MKPNNPFVLVGYQGDKYFCDCEQETERLLGWIRNDSNVTLMASRRFGKTGLLHHVFARLPPDCTGIYLDIYSTRSQADLAKLLAESVVNAMDTPVEKTLSTIGRSFRGLRPSVTPRARFIFAGSRHHLMMAPQGGSGRIGPNTQNAETRDRLHPSGTDPFRDAGLRTGER